MAKASLALPSGHMVELDGTPEEVAELLRLYSGTYSTPSSKSGKQARRGGKGAAATPAKSTKTSKIGPKGCLLELHQANYFAQKRTLGDVQKVLEEQAHIYAQNSLSTPLVRLVREKVLRRIKEDGAWVYVNA